MIPYTPPTFRLDAFNCPFCHAYAIQEWQDILAKTQLRAIVTIEELDRAVCFRCEKTTLWLDQKLLYPDATVAEPPNSDMPLDVKMDYEEAASIVNKSPRGAAALLRLGIQKLCKELGEKGKEINIDIGNLVKRGLPVEVQQALDSVRVIGNGAVHPGELDLRDDIVTATALFRCLNVIVDRMITQPKELEALYQSLPRDKLDQIQKRDGTAPPA